ncbi:MAG: chromosome partitioning protein ParB, partial [Flavobacteriaceae bacterium]
PIVQTGMRDGFLSMGHGRALINVEESEKQLEIYEKIIARSLSVRETELLVQKAKKGQSAATTKAPQPLFYDDAVEELKSYFNTAVTIKGNDKGKGNIQIPFDSQKDLNEIIKKIKSED